MCATIWPIFFRLLVFLYSFYWVCNVHMLVLRTSSQTIGQRILIKWQTINISFYLTYIYYKNKYRFFNVKLRRQKSKFTHFHLFLAIVFISSISLRIHFLLVVTALALFDFCSLFLCPI